jgi:hypothetical protein
MVINRTTFLTIHHLIRGLKGLPANFEGLLAVGTRTHTLEIKTVLTFLAQNFDEVIIGFGESRNDFFQFSHFFFNFF